MANIVKMSIDGVSFELQDLGARQAIEDALKNVAEHKDIVDDAVAEVNIYSADTRKRSDTATALSEASVTISEKSLLDILTLREEILKLLATMRNDLDNVISQTNEMKITLNDFTEKTAENLEKAEELRELCVTEGREACADLQTQLNNLSDAQNASEKNISKLYNVTQALQSKDAELDQRSKDAENTLIVITKDDGKLDVINRSIEELRAGLEATTTILSKVSIKENEGNNVESYKLDITTKDVQLTTPNLKNNSFILQTELGVSMTVLTLTDPRIRESARVEVFTDVYGVNPNNVVVSDGSCVMNFTARTTVLHVRVLFDYDD